MSMSDPLADFLTRIRNAVRANFDTVEIPQSQLKVNVAEVLKKEGYIKDFQLMQEGVQGAIRIELKYGPRREQVITGIRRVSKPGLRQYRKSQDIPKVMSGLGLGILTTSKGVISDREARRLNVGGELLCEVW
jgi:small subunit ribosomal protein S8